MTRFDAIVIGGGVNGLVAGSVLARRGKSVCILEQRADLGGMATLAKPGGPPLAHLLYNLSPRVRQDIGLDPDRWPFATTALPTVSLCEQGRHVVVRGTDVENVDGTAHPDADAYRALVRQLTNFGAVLRRLAEAPPPGTDAPIISASALRQFWRMGRLGLDIKRLGKPDMRRFLQVLLSNAHDLILDEMPDGPLTGMLAADAVRGAAAGPRSPGTVFDLIYRMGHGGEVRIPDGGMGSVIDAFAQAARDAGCRIETGTAVARVLIEEDRVTGVETEAGDRFNAPLVLASIGAAGAARMAGPAQFDIEQMRRIRNIRARGTAAKINFRLSRALAIPGLPQELTRARLIVAPSADYVERAFNPAKYGEMSDAPVIEAILTGTPPGAAEGPWLSAIVQYAPSDLKGGWTEAACEKLLHHTTDALARIAPDLPKTVTDTQVITPDQIAAATGAPGGHWHHAEMSLDQLLTLRPPNGMARYSAGPGGLFLCGASTHPGGDIMGLSGRNAALAALEARP